MSSRKWKRGCYPIKMDLKLIEEEKPKRRLRTLKWKWRSLPSWSASNWVSKKTATSYLLWPFIRNKARSVKNAFLLLALTGKGMCAHCPSFHISFGRWKLEQIQFDANNIQKQEILSTSLISDRCISVQIYPSPKILHTSQVGWMILLIWPDIKPLQICPNAFKCIYLK